MLEIKNLSFNVKDDRGELGIIDDVSLTINDGEFVVITGPNGGGKSTLARLIMGIEKPTSGKIFYNGTDITDMSITERKAGSRLCLPAASALQGHHRPQASEPCLRQDPARGRMLQLPHRGRPLLQGLPQPRGG